MQQPDVWDELDALKFADERAVIRQLLDSAPLDPAARGAIVQEAALLVEAARASARRHGVVESFLQEFSLGTREGLALMCLAEAFLRTPDADTRGLLIAEKIGMADWASHLGKSDSLFVNASTWGLMLTGRLVDVDTETRADLPGFLKRLAARAGEPVIRQAAAAAMRIMGEQFVLGRTIGDALVRARRENLLCSFDMLGEGARTAADAARYTAHYAEAIAAVGAEAGDTGPEAGHGISVKLSALCPRYEAVQEARVWQELYPRLKALALAAARHNLNLAIDAEEADRLTLSLKLVDRLAREPDLGDWSGLGVVVQAYQKRGLAVIGALAGLAEQTGRRIMVRLVKGAYWDSEIKAAQVAGLDDYPVWTRKLATDVSYLACARHLLAASDCIYPAFATHNANTIGAVKALAGETPFEFQRLHGMGEGLYQELAKLEAGIGETRTPVRIYAPVGTHKELLAYLVRRLLENGANSSFVNRIADESVQLDDLVRDPVAELAAMAPRRNPAIPLPNAIFGPGRRNSAGLDLSDPRVRDPLLKRLDALDGKLWAAQPTLGGKGAGEPVVAPYDRGEVIGKVIAASVAEVDAAVRAASAAQPAWNALGGVARAALLDAAADRFEHEREQLFSLCIREAGKTLIDAVLEVREAVDFLRYYAAEARRQFAVPTLLPGPTGELNQLTLHGRGVFACISPWNFPLAIFIGPVAAALAAGNAAIAKPAEQTPLIGALAIELMHQVGIPREIVQVVPGDGTVGAALTAHPLIAGVAFTGSTDTARAINRGLADRDGPIIPLIAETGGQNAMIVDSSALPEQVTRDVVASSFQSAGQRCSALRVLFLQDDVADGMLAMIKGAMEALTIGDPRELATDVGPVIDAEAKAALDAHSEAMAKSATLIARLDLPKAAAKGSFVAPAIFEIGSLSDLTQENFGPILHVIRWKSGALDDVIDQINASGFGLTLGLQSRIDSVRERVEARARVGNIYINRNQIGAVVESQPFGGEGLSGTGPKAGGPHYVARFATERVTCIDTTAAGGNASLMAAIDG